MRRFKLQRIYEHLKESMKPKVKNKNYTTDFNSAYTACPNLISFVSVDYALAFCPPVVRHNL